MSQFISNIKHYAVGTMGHYIVIDKNNIASGFGRNDYGQISSISGKYLTGVRQIEAGGYHTVILFEDGRVSGFGRDDYGQATFGNNLTGVTKIAAGQFHNLAIYGNNKVTGWGEETNTIIREFAPVDYPIDESIAKGGNNLTGVKDISAGYSSSYAVLNNNNITGWGKAKFKYNDSNIINYPINFGAVKKIDAGYNFASILLENGEGVSIRHYAQDNPPSVPFSEIFSSDYDPSFRGSQFEYSGYILNNSGGSILTGINDISAGTNYTIASVTSGFITGWGYAPYDQINFYNKNSLKQQRTIQIKSAGTFTGDTIPGLPTCIPAWIFKQSGPNLIPKDSGDFNIKNLKAGWNITAALASGSGLFIIGNEQQFLYENDFALGTDYLGNTNEIYLNRFPTGDYTDSPLIPAFGILKLSGFGITGINKNFKRDTTDYYGAFNQSGIQDEGNPLYTCYFDGSESWRIRQQEDILTSLDHINSITLTGSYFNNINTTYSRPDDDADAINLNSESQDEQINWDNNSGYWRLSTTGIVPNYIKKITLYYDPNNYISLGDQDNIDYYISMSSENVYDYQFFIYQDSYEGDIVWTLHDGDYNFYNINGNLSNTNWTGVNGNNNMTGSTGSFISNYSPGFVYKTSGNFQLTGNIIWEKDEYGVDPVPIPSDRGTGSFGVYDLYINNSNPLLLNNGTWETIYPKAIDTTYRNVPYDPTLATGYSMNKPPPIFKFDAFSTKLIKYTGNPTGILNKWPYGTEAVPITGAEAYPFEPSFFEYLYIEDKQNYPKAIVFANPQEGLNDVSFLSGLQITGDTYPVINEKSVLFGFLKTGSNPSLGVNNYYFSPQGKSFGFEITNSQNSLFHKIPCSLNHGTFTALKWRLISGGSTGDGSHGTANENIAPVVFSRPLSEYEIKNYYNFNILPQPFLTAEILGSTDYESNKIKLTFGFSQNSLGQNIYRKRKDYIEDFSFFSGVINDPDANTVNIVEDYSPDYGAGTGTYLQYKIYPWNAYGSGDYRMLQAQILTTPC